MTLREYLKSIDTYFINENKEYEAIKMLLIELHYQSVANLLLGYDKEFPSYLTEVCNKYLIDNIPVQYILGYEYFYGLKINVNKNTLIPRKDTEVVVSKAIEIINNNNYKNVLDLCCGSGAIGLAIKNEVNDAFVSSSDISKKALEITLKNKIELGLDIEIINSDLFDNIENKYDIIVSNPPYISKDEEVSELVLNNEPHLALFAENDGLYFYDKILSDIKGKMDKVKTIVFEIGYKQSKSIEKIAKCYFPNCQFDVYLDYGKRDRVVVITL